MRGDLTKVEGFSNIQTDINKRTCSFHYAKSRAELKSQLDELAKSNPHLQDWSEKN